jgi:cytoskeletal protein RodZ
VTPQAFGEKLRREREKKRITLDQLATRTKVAASLLRSLEAGDCARWPGGIYSRGFVRAYAQGTGMDPEHTVGLFVECYPAFAPEADPLNELIQDTPAAEGPQTLVEKIKSAVVEFFRVAIESKR